MTELTDELAATLLAVAQELADAARAAILPHFRSVGLDAVNKDAGGFDPVTVADREAEQAMRAVLARRRPDDGILGEEFGTEAGTTGLTWVLDPIDGTRGFISGTPTWGVLIAVSGDDGPLIGLIDQPYIGERFIGGPHGAHLTGPDGARRLTSRRGGRLSDAILFTTFPEVGSDAERDAFRALSGKVRLTRYGMDCYAYALVAAGQVDLVVEAGLKPYDVHAPIAVIEAAGGVVTDWKGRKAHGGGRILAAANPSVHAEALAILGRAA